MKKFITNDEESIDNIINESTACSKDDSNERGSTFVIFLKVFIIFIFIGFEIITLKGYKHNEELFYSTQEDTNSEIEKKFIKRSEGFFMDPDYVTKYKSNNEKRNPTLASGATTRGEIIE